MLDMSLMLWMQPIEASCNTPDVIDGQRPWHGRGLAIVFLIALVVLATAMLTVKALGLRSVEAHAEPFELPPDDFDWGWWNLALGRWVRAGGVDYDAVRKDEGDLRRFVATLGAVGPRSAPARFGTEPERLAYYINAYNALVLFAVVDNWPIRTVHDVRGWLDPRAGFGFFYGLRFPLDGDATNLYELENEVIRGFVDARIHAAINCASKSCPSLMPHAFEAATLDEQLDMVTRGFCSSAEHVRVDEEAREIQVSAIFDWYRSDFEEHARRLGRPATILDFIVAFAAPEIASALEQARGDDFALVFRAYDWDLNQI
jgi:hypothetical protein